MVARQVVFHTTRVSLKMSMSRGSTVKQQGQTLHRNYVSNSLLWYIVIYHCCHFIRMFYPHECNRNTAQELAANEMLIPWIIVPAHLTLTLFPFFFFILWVEYCYCFYTWFQLLFLTYLSAWNMLPWNQWEGCGVPVVTFFSKTTWALQPLCISVSHYYSQLYPLCLSLTLSLIYCETETMCLCRVAHHFPQRFLEREKLRHLYKKQNGRNEKSCSVALV